MDTDTCPKCGGPLNCLAGTSAHPDNWFCVDEEGCGWRAWENRDRHDCPKHTTGGGPCYCGYPSIYSRRRQ